MVQASPRRHDPRRAGLVPVQGRPGPGDLRRQGVEPAPAPVQLLRRPPRPAPAHGPDGGHGRVGRVDDRPQRGRGADARVLADQGAQPALQRPPARRQELPVPRRHRRRAVAAGAGDARPQAQGHPLLRARTPTPTPSATRSTSCCARSRSARAARPSSTSTSGSAGRACCTTSRSAPVRASARSRRCRTASSSTELCDFLDGDTDPIVKRLDAEMRGAAGGAGVREGGPAARPAGDGAAGDRAPADGGRPQRGPRRHRHRRRRARGVGAGVLRAPGTGRRAQGLRARQGRGADARAG